MKFFIGILLATFVLMPCFGSVQTTNAKDSLLTLVDSAGDKHLKIRYFRDLADICFETPDEMKYLRKMYELAKDASDSENMFEALAALSFAKLKENELDSASYYMELLQKSGTTPQTIGHLTYLRMRFSDYEQFKTDDIVEPDDKDLSVYTRIEREYMVANGLMSQGQYQKAIPYLETVLDLTKTLPEKEAYKFTSTVLWSLARSYRAIGDGKKTITIIEAQIEDRHQYYDKYYKRQRPFYNINARYIQDYASLLSNIRDLSQEKASEYLRCIMNLTENTDNEIDRYSRYLSMNNYYLYKQEYSLAQQANDSLIAIAWRSAHYNLPELYQVSSLTYKAMGKYKEAFESLAIAYDVKDSLSSSQTLEQINELQVKYDVDKLTYDKAQLEIKNKRILLVSLVLILLGSVVGLILLLLNLRKETRMKEHLRMLNIKADESEQMKTAFINAVCHEIRTPLNAIVGFSSLIYDESIDAVTKKEFADLIQKNTHLLTSQIDNMLEVANLDTSHDKLLMEDVSVNAICMRAIGQIRDFGKPNIAYRLDVPSEDFILHTHQKYLSLVIWHLMENANKFTQEGLITLGYSVDVSGRLVISVTDTGCGIPHDKQEVVFERFTKLDTFTQGSGLGLYLCRLIMSRINGELVIDPMYVDGTRFMIVIPAKKAF